MVAPQQTRVEVGVIGCGSLAQTVLLPILKRLPGVSLAALAESDPDRLQAAHRCVPAAAVHADHRDLLRMKSLHAVVVSVPTGLHAEVAIAAMQAGKHLYLEKPIAKSLHEAEDVLAAWRQSGVIGMIGFNYRLSAPYQSARRQIQAGRVGAMIGAQSAFSTPSRPMPLWKQARSSGGGVLLDLASHHVDLARFLFQQEVRAVYAEVESRRTEQDTATLHLHLAEGLLVQSFFSLATVDEDRFEIYGHSGKLSVDRYRSPDLEITDAAGLPGNLRRAIRRLNPWRRIPHLFEKLRTPRREPSYPQALSLFISAVRGGGQPSPDLLDGYRSLEVICAAEQSARTGRSVALTPAIVDPEKGAQR